LFALLVKNDELAASYHLGVIIIMGYAYRPYYWVSISRLQYTENTSKLWRISFIAGIVNVVLNLIFIPRYGVFAAAVSTLISLLYVGFSGFFLKAFKEHETEKYYPITVLSIVIASSVLVYFIRDNSVGNKIILSILLLSCYILYWFGQKEKFRQIRW
jgi:O-antigen/teichoic acid export membrane protein